MSDPIDPRITALFDEGIRRALRSYGVQVSVAAKHGAATVLPEWLFGEPIALVHPDDALEALRLLTQARQAQRAEEASGGPR